MNFNDIKDPKAQQMLKDAGITQEKLNGVDVDKLNKILSDPAMLEKIMSTPAAKALLKRFKTE